MEHLDSNQTHFRIKFWFFTFLLYRQGVIGSLADLFEAHPVVKAIMNEESQLTRAFAGSE